MGGEYLRGEHSCKIRCFWPYFSRKSRMALLEYGVVIVAAAFCVLKHPFVYSFDKAFLRKICASQNLSLLRAF
ncbi:hypothetical protein [Bartonella sp. AU55XJBT]|uniref:hypothetical protein n=1 Tax=Bartonella sp. AU55XJBT TaxID=3019091 RepID=UPI00235E6F82|nr:hypothetical protein [Bartonella sp. AU55XJBT]